MSIHWPLPVRARISNAAWIALADHRPHARSDIDTPDFIGSPSGSPVIDISPLIAWITKSYPGSLRRGPSCPKPDIEQ